MVLSKCLQDVFQCFQLIVIHSVEGPRSECHNFHQAFSSMPRAGIHKLWFIVARPIHQLWIHEPKHVLCFEPNAAMVSRSRSCVLRQSMPMARLHEARTGDGPDDSGTLQPQKHVCPWYGRAQRRPQATHIACTAELRTQTKLFVVDSVVH